MKKILFIDNCANFLDSLVALAKELGWVPFSAESVEAAKLMLLRDTYDTISIDYSLDDGTAIDVLNYIAKYDIDSRTIVLSGYNEDSIRNAVFQAGAVEYIEKGSPGFLNAIFKYENGIGDAYAHL